MRYSGFIGFEERDENKNYTLMVTFVLLQRHNIIIKNIVDKNRRIQFLFKCYTLFFAHVYVNIIGTAAFRQGICGK